MQASRLLTSVSTAILLGAGILAAVPAFASSDKPVIALSNAYYGNTWRHQMVQAFEAAAKKAKTDGKIADYIILNGDGSVAQQNSQIAELILKHVDGLAIDAASETAVNGIIAKACKAGIKVVSFDSIASAPCNYQLNFDFTGYKAKEAEWVMKKLGGKGNIIQVRGVKGSAPDHDMYEAQQSVLKKYPNVKVVATVYGQATASVAQSAIANVLPSLPHVDAVLGQGGSDDFGIARAFEQYGGQYKTKMPIIEGGGSTDFIKWWADQHKKNGYTTISMNTTPGIGGAAFYLTLELVKGAKAPKKMIMPVATVTQDNLSEYTSMPSGMIVSPTYTQDWVVKNLLKGK
ncbi:MAG: ABC transporter substrate-binding protein [Rhizobiaceae bacterium]